MRTEEHANEHGPSWWDVERAVERLEGEWDCTIVVSMQWVVRKSVGKGYWWVRAAAHERKHLDKPARQIGGAEFRGGDGWKTATGAMWWALVALEDRLTEGKAKAEQQALF